MLWIFIDVKVLGCAIALLLYVHILNIYGLEFYNIEYAFKNML